MQRIAIIVAGGKGLRLGAEIPKQFLLLGAKPILMHTLERFRSFDQRVLVLPSEHKAFWVELCQKHSFQLKHSIVEGGKTRFHSVQNALKSLKSEDQDLVAIHDGVRPFISQDLLTHLCEVAEREASALPSLPLVESLRRKQGSMSKAVNRQDFCTVQTPQVFKFSKIKQAYEQPYQDNFTDDASVYETLWQEPVQLIDGLEQNIKITHEKDLILAEYFLKNFSF